MKKSFDICALLILPISLAAVVDGFSTLVLTRQSSPTRHVLSAGGKGFGSAPEPSTPKKKKSSSPQPSLDNTDSAPMAASPQAKVASPTPAAPPQMNAGQRALAEMRRERAEAKDAELRKIRDMMQADRQVEEAPAAIPEKVAQRMGTRMLGFVGVPLFLGLGSFVVFWYLATYKDMEFQPGLVAATTIGILAIGLLGITYSVMSTSWDEDREGGVLGADEFQKNVANIKDGLDRSKENAMLRDKMAQAGSVDIERAVADMERREQQEEKARNKAASLESKLKEELE